MKKALSFIMAFIMILVVIPAPASAATTDNFTVKNDYAQGQFTDIKATAWYARNIQKCYELGLMNGRKKDQFDANGKVTLAEVITTAARAHNIYNGGDGNIPKAGTAWYDGAVTYALNNGIIKKGDFANYNLNATRGQVAYIFANILPRSEFIELNYIDTLPDVYYDVPYSQPTVFLYGAGVLTGSDKYGTFNGSSYITRAEAATLIVRVVSPADRVTFAPDSYIFEGNIPIVDPYTKFRYFNYPNTEPAPALDYDTIKVVSIQGPYNNGTNQPSELVTKSEGVKVILSMVLAKEDSAALAKKAAGSYPNAAWVAFAEEQGLINSGVITAGNQASPITLEESLNCLLAALRKFAPEVDFSLYTDVIAPQLDKYSETTKSDVYFAYYNDLLDARRLSYYEIDLEEELTKGNMDELLKNAVNKLNVMNGKINQIKTTDLPKNADLYPYIIAGIENAVYEMPFSGWNSGEANPRPVYKYMKDQYDRFDRMITEAYTDIVNVDYETISADSFRNAKTWSLDYSCGWVDELDDRIESYITYVKQNKIKITGKVTPLLPIVYCDGQTYRIRTKIEYNIVSSNTNVDLLLCDRICYSGSLKLCYSPTIYEKKTNTIYVDIAVDAGLTFNEGEIGSIYYLDKYFPLSKQIAGKFSVVTVKL